MCRCFLCRFEGVVTFGLPALLWLGVLFAPAPASAGDAGAYLNYDFLAGFLSAEAGHDELVVSGSIGPGLYLDALSVRSAFEFSSSAAGIQSAWDHSYVSYRQGTREWVFGTGMLEGGLLLGQIQGAGAVVRGRLDAETSPSARNGIRKAPTHPKDLPGRSGLDWGQSAYALQVSSDRIFSHHPSRPLERPSDLAFDAAALIERYHLPAGKITYSAGIVAGEGEGEEFSQPIAGASIGGGFENGLSARLIALASEPEGTISVDLARTAILGGVVGLSLSARADKTGIEQAAGFVWTRQAKRHALAVSATTYSDGFARFGNEGRRGGYAVSMAGSFDLNRLGWLRAYLRAERADRALAGERGLDYAWSFAPGAALTTTAAVRTGEAAGGRVGLRLSIRFGSGRAARSEPRPGGAGATEVRGHIRNERFRYRLSAVTEGDPRGEAYLRYDSHRGMFAAASKLEADSRNLELSARGSIIASATAGVQAARAVEGGMLAIEGAPAFALLFVDGVPAGRADVKGRAILTGLPVGRLVSIRAQPRQGGAVQERTGLPWAHSAGTLDFAQGPEGQPR